MIVVKMSGGLGNQMYQYAVYRALLAQGADALMDTSFYEKQQEGIVSCRTFDLEAAFPIIPRYATDSQTMLAGRTQPDLFHRGLRAMGLWKPRVIRDAERGFQPGVLDVTAGVLEGYWQSFRYADLIADELRKEFAFKQPLDPRSAELAEEMRAHPSVGISVRRDDYTKMSDIYHLEPRGYFTAAMNLILDKVPGARFYCTACSEEDFKWARENLEGRITFIDWTSGVTHMHLLSLCDHSILTNSTFTLWAAWLNDNPDKIVIRPERYFSSPSREIPDFWPDDWLVLPS